jgi:WD40 repeat protein
MPLPDGRVLLATGGDDGMIRLWDPHALTPIGEPLTGHDKDVDAMCQLDLPDGRPLLVSGDSTGTVRLWDPQRGTIVDTLRVTAPVVGLGVLNDGRLLVATSFPAYTFRVLV